MNCQKSLFSLPESVHYLNCATMSPLSKAVEAAGIAGVLRKSQPQEIYPEHFFDLLETVKARFAQLIGCTNPQRIALMPSVSYGLAVVAKNIARRADISRRPNIVLVGDEFPSDVYAWDELLADHSARIVTVKAPPYGAGRGAAWNEQLLAAIDEQTLLVCISPTHWADGTLFDLAALRQRCTQYGASLVIDATQHLGGYPLDVAQIQPDFLVCATYKWLLGPYGSALAYCPEWLDYGSPLEQSWMARQNSDDFKSLINYQAQYRPHAYRYNVGESSQFIHLPMIAAALQHLLDWTPTAIQQYAQQLSTPLLPILREAGYWIEETPYRANHLWGIQVPPHQNLDTLQNKLRAAGIYVSYRGNAVRLSINVWNDASDINALATALRGGA